SGRNPTRGSFPILTVPTPQLSQRGGRQISECGTDISKITKQQRKHPRRLAVDCILIVEMEVRKTTRKAAHSGPASIFCHQIDPGRASKQHTVRRKFTTTARDHTAIPPDPLRTDSNL